jgi:hypothetical protein
MVPRTCPALRPPRNDHWCLRGLTADTGARTDVLMACRGRLVNRRAAFPVLACGGDKEDGALQASRHGEQQVQEYVGVGIQAFVASAQVLISDQMIMKPIKPPTNGQLPMPLRRISRRVGPWSRMLCVVRARSSVQRSCPKSVPRQRPQRQRGQWEVCTVQTVDAALEPVKISCAVKVGLESRLGHGHQMDQYCIHGSSREMVRCASRV